MQVNGISPFQETVPDEVAIIVFENLKSDDLQSVGRTCRRLQHSSSDPSLWALKVQADFNKNEIQRAGLTNKNWKGVYLQCQATKIRLCKQSLFSTFLKSNQLSLNSIVNKFIDTIPREVFGAAFKEDWQGKQIDAVPPVNQD